MRQLDSAEVVLADANRRCGNRQTNILRGKQCVNFRQLNRSVKLRGW